MSTEVEGPKRQTQTELTEDHSFVGMLKKEWPQIRKFLFQLGCHIIV
jgi:hypothetical protein